MKSFPNKILSLFLVSVYFSTHVALGALAESHLWAERRAHLSQASSSNQSPNSIQLASLPMALPQAQSLLNQLPTAEGKIQSLSKWSEANKKQAAHLPTNLQKLIDAIPQNVANIQDVYAPEKTIQNSSPVVLIQDIHLNNEAQSNIARVLQQLINQKQVGTVGVEGSFTEFKFSHLRSFPNKKITTEVADDFINKNLLAAPSFVGITSQMEPPLFVGIDDREHYDANVSAYRSTLKQKESVKVELEKLSAQMSIEKKKVLNPKLKVFDDLRGSYQSGNLGLGDYVRLLVKESESLSRHSRMSLSGIHFAVALRQHGSPTKNFGDDSRRHTAMTAMDSNGTFVLDQFLEAFNLERSLDFKKVDVERKAVIEKLSKKLNQEETSVLLSQSLAYRLGQMSFGSYYQSLKSLCEAKGISFRATPTFDNYIRYVLLSDGIKADKLFDAVANLENTTLASLMKTPEEKLLMERSQQFALSKKLIEFALTPTEWEKYKSLATGDWKMATGSIKSPFSSRQSPNLSSFERFYEEADIRSQKMVENLLRQIPNSKSKAQNPKEFLNPNKQFSKINNFGFGVLDFELPKPQVLVVGGFHTPGITQLLRSQNISYVVISPKVTKLDSEQGSAYLSAFAQEKTPLDKLFSGEKLFLALETQNITAPSCEAQLERNIYQRTYPSRLPWWLRAPARERIVQSIFKTEELVSSLALRPTFSFRWAAGSLLNHALTIISPRFASSKMGKALGIIGAALEAVTIIYSAHHFDCSLWMAIPVGLFFLVDYLLGTKANAVRGSPRSPSKWSHVLLVVAYVGLPQLSPLFSPVVSHPQFILLFISGFTHLFYDSVVIAATPHRGDRDPIKIDPAIKARVDQWAKASEVDLTIERSDGSNLFASTTNIPVENSKVRPVVRLADWMMLKSENSFFNFLRSGLIELVLVYQEGRILGRSPLLNMVSMPFQFIHFVFKIDSDTPNGFARVLKASYILIASFSVFVILFSPPRILFKGMWVRSWVGKLTRQPIMKYPIKPNAGFYFLDEATFDVKKPTVILCHGVSSDLTDFERIIDSLKDEANIAIFSFDHLRPLDELADEFIEARKNPQLNTGGAVTTVGYSHSYRVIERAVMRDKSGLFQNDPPMVLPGPLFGGAAKSMAGGSWWSTAFAKLLGRVSENFLIHHIATETDPKSVDVQSTFSREGMAEFLSKLKHRPKAIVLKDDFNGPYGIIPYVPTFPLTGLIRLADIKLFEANYQRGLESTDSTIVEPQGWSSFLRHYSMLNDDEIVPIILRDVRESIAVGKSGVNTITRRSRGIPDMEKDSIITERLSHLTRLLLEWKIQVEFKGKGENEYLVLNTAADLNRVEIGKDHGVQMKIHGPYAPDYLNEVADMMAASLTTKTMPAPVQILQQHLRLYSPPVHRAHVSVAACSISGGFSRETVAAISDVMYQLQKEIGVSVKIFSSDSRFAEMSSGDDRRSEVPIDQFRENLENLQIKQGNSYSFDVEGNLSEKMLSSIANKIETFLSESDASSANGIAPKAANLIAEIKQITHEFFGQIVVRSPGGIHTRPSMALSQLAEGLRSEMGIEIYFRRQGQVHYVKADLFSLISLMAEYRHPVNILVRGTTDKDLFEKIRVAVEMLTMDNQGSSRFGPKDYVQAYIVKAQTAGSGITVSDPSRASKMRGNPLSAAAQSAVELRSANLSPEELSAELQVQFKALLNKFIGRNPNSSLDSDTLIAIQKKFLELPTNDERISFTSSVLELIFKGDSRLDPDFRSPSSEVLINPFISIQGTSIVDLSLQLGVDENGSLEVRGAIARPGSSGPNSAQILKNFGETISHYAYADGIPGQVYRRGLQHGQLGGTNFLDGRSRVSLFMFPPKTPEGVAAREVSFRPNNPVMDWAGINKLLDRIPPWKSTESSAFAILGGQVFPGLDSNPNAENPYKKLMDAVKIKGYAPAIDMQPYLTAEEMKMILAGSPTVVKFNLLEFSKVVDRSEGSLRGNVDLIKTLASNLAKENKVANLIVSMDEDGALAIVNEGSNIHQILVRAPKVDVVSTVSAGGSLFGTFLYQRRRGADVKTALEWGVAAGSASTELPGSQVANKAQIEKMLERVKSQNREKASNAGTGSQGDRLQSNTPVTSVASPKKNEILSRKNFLVSAVSVNYAISVEEKFVVGDDHDVIDSPKGLFGMGALSRKMKRDPMGDTDSWSATLNLLNESHRLLLRPEFDRNGIHPRVVLVDTKAPFLASEINRDHNPDALKIQCVHSAVDSETGLVSVYVPLKLLEETAKKPQAEKMIAYLLAESLISDGPFPSTELNPDYLYPGISQSLYGRNGFIRVMASEWEQRYQSIGLAMVRENFATLNPFNFPRFIWTLEAIKKLNTIKVNRWIWRVMWRDKILELVAHYMVLMGYEPQPSDEIIIGPTSFMMAFIEQNLRGYLPAGLVESKNFGKVFIHVSKKTSLQSDHLSAALGHAIDTLFLNRLGYAIYNQSQTIQNDPNNLIQPQHPDGVRQLARTDVGEHLRRFIFHPNSMLPKSMLDAAEAAGIQFPDERFSGAAIAQASLRKWALLFRGKAGAEGPESISYRAAFRFISWILLHQDSVRDSRNIRTWTDAVINQINQWSHRKDFYAGLIDHLNMERNRLASQLLPDSATLALLDHLKREVQFEKSALATDSLASARSKIETPNKIGPANSLGHYLFPDRPVIGFSSMVVEMGIILSSMLWGTPSTTFWAIGIIAVLHGPAWVVAYKQGRAPPLIWAALSHVTVFLLYFLTTHHTDSLNLFVAIPIVLQVLGDYLFILKPAWFRKFVTRFVRLNTGPNFPMTTIKIEEKVYPDATLIGEEGTKAYVRPLDTVETLRLVPWAARSGEPFSDEENRKFESETVMADLASLSLLPSQISSIRHSTYDRSSGVIVVKAIITTIGGEKIFVKISGLNTTAMEALKKLQPSIETLRSDPDVFQVSVGNQGDLKGNFSLISDGSKFQFFGASDEHPFDGSHRAFVQMKNGRRGFGMIQLKGNSTTGEVTGVSFTDTRDEKSIELKPVDTEFVMVAYTLLWPNVKARTLLSEQYTRTTDLRHLFRFPYLEKEIVLYDKVSSKQQILDKAIRGEKLSLECTTREGTSVDANQLQTELKKIGYRMVNAESAVEVTGDFYIHGNLISILLLPARYPINGLAVNLRTGKYVFVAVPGQSGKIGANYWTMGPWLTNVLGWTPDAFFVFDNGQDISWFEKPGARWQETPVRGRNPINMALVARGPKEDTADEKLAQDISLWIIRAANQGQIVPIMKLIDTSSEITEPDLRRTTLLWAMSLIYRYQEIFLPVIMKAGRVLQQLHLSNPALARVDTVEKFNDLIQWLTNNKSKYPAELIEAISLRDSINPHAQMDIPQPQGPANSLGHYIFPDRPVIGFSSMAVEMGIILSSMLWGTPSTTFWTIGIIAFLHGPAWYVAYKQGRAPPILWTVLSHVTVFLLYFLTYHYADSLNLFVTIPILLQVLGDGVFILKGHWIRPISFRSFYNRFLVGLESIVFVASPLGVPLTVFAALLSQSDYAMSLFMIPLFFTALFGVGPLFALLHGRKLLYQRQHRQISDLRKIFLGTLVPLLMLSGVMGSGFAVSFVISAGVVVAAHYLNDWKATQRNRAMRFHRTNFFLEKAIQFVKLLFGAKLGQEMLSLVAAGGESDPDEESRGVAISPTLFSPPSLSPLSPALSGALEEKLTPVCYVDQNGLEINPSGSESDAKIKPVIQRRKEEIENSFQRISTGLPSFKKPLRLALHSAADGRLYNYYLDNRGVEGSSNHGVLGFIDRDGVVHISMNFFVAHEFDASFVQEQRVLLDFYAQEVILATLARTRGELLSQLKEHILAWFSNPKFNTQDVNWSEIATEFEGRVPALGSLTGFANETNVFEVTFKQGAREALITRFIEVLAVKIALLAPTTVLKNNIISRFIGPSVQPVLKEHFLIGRAISTDGVKYKDLWQSYRNILFYQYHGAHRNGAEGFGPEYDDQDDIVYDFIQDRENRMTPAELFEYFVEWSHQGEEPSIVLIHLVHLHSLVHTLIPTLSGRSAIAYFFSTLRVVSEDGVPLKFDHKQTVIAVNNYLKTGDNLRLKFLKPDNSLGDIIEDEEAANDSDVQLLLETRKRVLQGEEIFFIDFNRQAFFRSQYEDLALEISETMGRNAVKSVIFLDMGTFLRRKQNRNQKDPFLVAFEKKFPGHVKTIRFLGSEMEHGFGDHSYFKRVLADPSIPSFGVKAPFPGDLSMTPIFSISAMGQHLFADYDGVILLKTPQDGGDSNGEDETVPDPNSDPSYGKDAPEEREGVYAGGGNSTDADWWKKDVTNQASMRAGAQWLAHLGYRLINNRSADLLIPSSSLGLNNKLVQPNLESVLISNLDRWVTDPMFFPMLVKELKIALGDSEKSPISQQRAEQLAEVMVAVILRHASPTQMNINVDTTGTHVIVLDESSSTVDALQRQRIQLMAVLMQSGLQTNNVIVTDEANDVSQKNIADVIELLHSVGFAVKTVVRPVLFDQFTTLRQNAEGRELNSTHDVFKNATLVVAPQSLLPLEKSKIYKALEVFAPIEKLVSLKTVIDTFRRALIAA